MLNLCLGASCERGSHWIFQKEEIHPESILFAFLYPFFHTGPLIALIASLFCRTITVLWYFAIDIWWTLHEREMVNFTRSHLCFIWKKKKDGSIFALRTDSDLINDLHLGRVPKGLSNYCMDIFKAQQYVIVWKAHISTMIFNFKVLRIIPPLDPREITEWHLWLFVAFWL